MNDNFKKIVNLQAMEEATPARTITNKPMRKKMRRSRAEEIDRVFANQENENKQDFAKIDRPVSKAPSSNLYKQVSIFLMLLLTVIAVYFFFLKNINPDSQEEKKTANEGAWYAIQLSDKETYYGFIYDTASDPVVVENVYYNYNQVVGQEEGEEQNSSIRLVKRGKESHGPDGSMSIVRSQVLFMEPLREDSKILRAILDYEK